MSFREEKKGGWRRVSHKRGRQREEENMLPTQIKCHHYRIPLGFVLLSVYNQLTVCSLSPLKEIPHSRFSARGYSDDGCFYLLSISHWRGGSLYYNLRSIFMILFIKQKYVICELLHDN